jgi:hypothetical protein
MILDRGLLWKAADDVNLSTDTLQTCAYMLPFRKFYNMALTWT